MREFLFGLLEIIRDVSVIVVAALVATVPTFLAVYFAYEKQSWFLGAVALLVFILSVSLAVAIKHRFGSC